MPSLAKVISKTPKKKLSISDWKWRSPGEVKAELNLTETPQHIQDFGQYMLEMAGKAKDKKLTARDLVKAYTITRSSIQRQATDVNNVIRAGLPLDPKMGKVRPEGAFSEWLGTPMGQRYLNAAEKGEVDQKAIADAVKIMAPFGKHEKDIPDALTWGAQNLPGREGRAAELVAGAAEGKSAPGDWRDFAKDVKGIGPAKAGFWASLLGRGDLPTLDARQVMIHTGKPTAASKKFLSNPRLGDAAVDRLSKRQADMNVPMPDELKPFYQHLTHHNVWDTAGNTKTTHADVVNAMKNYSILGLLGGGAGAAAMTAGSGDAEAGIKGFHASPHSFDKFDLSHMGKGQGGQIYGKGHYLTSSEDVASGAYMPKNHDGTNAGHMYEVDVDANPEDLLDYGKLLSEQSPQVRAALKKYYGFGYEGKEQGDWFGKDLIDFTTGNKDGALGLAEAGIPGAKYYDPSDKAENFVIFDEKKMNIVRKYGIAGASAMLGYNVLDGLSPAEAAEVQKQAYPTDSKEANTKSLANFLQDRGAAATQGASVMFDGETGREKSIPEQLDDIGAQAVAGVNRGVASLPGLPGDLGDLADWGLDAAGVPDNETLRNVINPGRMWPIRGEDSIKAWEDFSGDLPEATTDLGSVVDFGAQFLTPGPGELTTAALALPAAKKVIRLEDLAKDLGVAPVDLANTYTGLRYGKKRGPADTPPEEWTKTVVEQPHAPMQKRKLEDYLGKTITMTPADTATINHVEAINGRDLSTAVDPGGGPRYNLSEKRRAQNAAWAGAPGVATKEINRMKRLEDAGHDPIMAATTMRVDGVDYNSSVSDILLQRLQEGGLTADEMTELNDFLVAGLHRELGEDFRPELFPGIGSEKAIEDTRAYLLNNTAGPHGKVRAMMPKVLDTRGGRDRKAPEIGPIRFAVTDDEFAMQPAQHVGTSLFQIDPNGSPIPSDHGTYAAGYPKKPGSTSGRLEDLIPGGILFKDWATKKGATLNAANQMSSGNLKSFNMSGVHQKITEELLDDLFKGGWIK